MIDKRAAITGLILIDLKCIFFSFKYIGLVIKASIAEIKTYDNTLLKIKNKAQINPSVKTGNIQLFLNITINVYAKINNTLTDVNISSEILINEYRLKVKDNYDQAKFKR